jgi:general secretion pathway protein G
MMCRRTDIFGSREGCLARIGQFVWGSLFAFVLAVVLGGAVFLFTTFPHPHGGGTSRRAKTIAEIQRMAGAVKAFKADVGRCPTKVEGLEALAVCPKGLAGWKGPYLKRVPLDAWGDAYRYQCPASYGPDEFSIDSCGPNQAFGDDDDVLYTERM